MKDYMMWLDDRGIATWDNGIGELIVPEGVNIYDPATVDEYKNDEVWNGLDVPGIDTDEDDFLIDDDDEIRETLSSILELYDYAITVCDGGKKGLEELSNQNFDCILLDLTMPKFSGFNFLEELGHEKILSNNVFSLSVMNLSNEQQNYLIKMGIKKNYFKTYWNR